MENSLPDYKDFRTDLTFTDVRRMLKLEARKKYSRGQYMFITRATVLGRWHQLKKELYSAEEKFYQLAKGN